MAKFILVLAFVWSVGAARLRQQQTDSAQGREIETAGKIGTNLSAALEDADSENYCANFQYDHTYAKCSAFIESSRLTEAYCNAPVSASKIVDALKHDKCIKCSLEEVKQVCKEVEKPCSTEAVEQLQHKDYVCRAIVFGYTTKGRKRHISDLSGSEDLRGLSCNLNMLERYCKETWLPSARLCSALTTEEVDAVCTKFLPQKNSANEAAGLAGGIFGANCGVAEVRKMCNKQSCSDFTDEELDKFCDERVEAGLTAAEASLYVQEHEALDCSKELILAKCPKPCEVSADDEAYVCNLVTFGYTSKGRPHEAKLEDILHSKNIHCTSEAMDIVCKERIYPACDTLPDETKKEVCERLSEKGVNDLPKYLGGKFGVACTATSIREMCGKSTCDSLDDTDWKPFCEAKAEHGLTREEMADLFEKYEHLQCSTAQIKAHCQTSCEMKDSVAKRICPVLLSGYSQRKAVKWTDSSWQKQGIRCTIAVAKEACADNFQFKACHLNNEEKEKVCELRNDGNSDQFVSAIVQSELSMDCSPEYIALLCTK